MLSVLGKRREAAGLGDQLQDCGLRVERISSGPGHLTGDEGALAANLNHRNRDLRIVEKAFQFFCDQILNLERRHSAHFHFINQRQ